jgi:hypothetical protein
MVGAPRGFAGKLEQVRIESDARKPANILLLFVKSKQDLEQHFYAATDRVAKGGGLWIVWPKKTSTLASDLTQQVVRDYGMSRQFVDHKICALDETWSGLLFRRRAAGKTNAAATRSAS